MLRRFLNWLFPVTYSYYEAKPFVLGEFSMFLPKELWTPEMKSRIRFRLHEHRNHYFTSRYTRTVLVPFIEGFPGDIRELVLRHGVTEDAPDSTTR